MSVHVIESALVLMCDVILSGKIPILWPHDNIFFNFFEKIAENIIQ
jgi:hypothetical protein